MHFFVFYTKKESPKAPFRSLILNYAIFVTKNMAYIKFRKRVMMAVLIRSANIAPMIGTIRNGFTV